VSATFDDHFDDHPKYAERTAAEMGLIACAITYANRNLTDGVIPRVWPERRFGRSGSHAAKELVKAGIWKQDASGAYEVVGFLDHNPSRAEVLADRARVAEAKAKAGQAGGIRSGQARMARCRAEAASSKSLKVNARDEANAKQTVEANEADAKQGAEAGRSRQSKQTKQNEALSDQIRSDQISPLPPEGDAGGSEIADVPSETRLKTDPMGDHEIGDAWARGVTEGSGHTMAPPSRGELRELVALAAAHGPARTGMHGSRNVASWARERGEAFGEAHRDAVRNVWKFRDWVNSGGAKPGVVKRFEAPAAPAIEKYVAPKPGFNSQGERVDYDVPPPATFGRKAT
jgi:hypothetical protein